MAYFYGPEAGKIISDHLKLPISKHKKPTVKTLFSLQRYKYIHMATLRDGDKTHADGVIDWFQTLNTE